MKKMLSRLRPSLAKHRSRATWQECGLAAGYILGSHFLDLEDLHYGYWPSELTVSAANLKAAQSNYSQMLISRVPQRATYVLDVGAGAGSVAARLAERGHSVDCVSPNEFLTAQIRKRLGDKVGIFECRFQELQPNRRYDAVIFAESFQYVPAAAGLDQAAAHLKPGGSLVISDFFAKDEGITSPIRGGHPLGTFRDLLATRPFETIEDLDITTETAPTIKVANDAFQSAVWPLWVEFWNALQTTHPFWAKATHGLFRKRLDKFEAKYFSGTRTPEAFREFKEYHLLHLRSTASN